MDENISAGKGSGIALTTFLCPEHNFQPLGILNHTHTHNNNSINNQHSGHLGMESQLFLDMDTAILRVLDIPRLSDSQQFNLQVRVEGNTTLLNQATDHFEAILLLLQCIHNATSSSSLHNNTNSNNINGDNNESSLLVVPTLLKAKAIKLQFKTPKMEVRMHGL